MPEENQENQERQERPEQVIFTFEFFIPFPGSEYRPGIRGLRPLGHRRHSQIMDILFQNAHVFAAVAAENWLRQMQDPHLQGQPPASEKALSELKVIPILSEKRRLKHKLCAICQEDFLSKDCIAAHTKRKQEAEESGEKLEDDVNIDHVIQMPCHHVFHQNCLKTWLASSGTCPSCRFEIETENQEYNKGIQERMKERVDKLKDEVDTDDEDYQVVENSFVVPRGQKRKRDVDSDVGESGESSTAKREKLSLAADVVDTTAVDESIVESTDEPIVDTNADTKAETDTTETKDPAETTRETKTTDTDKETPTEYQTNERQEQSTSRGVLGTLFPFLL